MKRYTVYEIEKLTKGKLTKYKLNQAIQKGYLVAEKVQGMKKGKGIPKYYIYEDKLQDYLKKIESERKKNIILPGEEPTQNINSELKVVYEKLIIQKDILIKDQGEKISDLMDRIKLLEEAVDTSDDLEDMDEDQANGRKKRREIIVELANTSFFSIRRKNKLLTELSKIS
jgi:hypothetical protein